MVIRDGRRIFLAVFSAGFSTIFREAVDTPDVSGVVAHRSGHTRRCHPSRSVARVEEVDSCLRRTPWLSSSPEPRKGTRMRGTRSSSGSCRSSAPSPASTGCRRPTATTWARRCGCAWSSTSATCASPRPCPGGSAPRPATSACGCSPRAAGPAWSTRRRVAWTASPTTSRTPSCSRPNAARRSATRLAELPEGRRELLLLLLVDPPLAYEEISRRLGIPIGSIGPTRARAFAQLRETDRAIDTGSDRNRRGTDHDRMG